MPGGTVRRKSMSLSATPTCGQKKPRRTGVSSTTVRGRSEGDRPAVDVAGVGTEVVVDAKLPGAVERLARQVHVVGRVDVVGAAAAAVVQHIHAAIRSHEIDLQVADVGVDA